MLSDQLCGSLPTTTKSLDVQGDDYIQGSITPFPETKIKAFANTLVGSGRCSARRRRRRRRQKRLRSRRSAGRPTRMPSGGRCEAVDCLSTPTLLDVSAFALRNRREDDQAVNIIEEATMKSRWPLRITMHSHDSLQADRVAAILEKQRAKEAALSELSAQREHEADIKALHRQLDLEDKRDKARRSLVAASIASLQIQICSCSIVKGPAPIGADKIMDLLKASLIQAGLRCLHEFTVPTGGGDAAAGRLPAGAAAEQDRGGPVQGRGPAIRQV